MQATRICPVCDGTTIHAEGCTAAADPTLTATWGTKLQQTADELERCWTALGQVKPNRHVTAARSLLQREPHPNIYEAILAHDPEAITAAVTGEPPTRTIFSDAADVVDALAAKFREAGFPDVDSCQKLLDILKDVEFTYTTPKDERPYFCCGMLPSEGHTATCLRINGE